MSIESVTWVLQPFGANKGKWVLWAYWRAPPMYDAQQHTKIMVD